MTAGYTGVLLFGIPVFVLSRRDATRLFGPKCRLSENRYAAAKAEVVTTTWLVG